MNPKTVFFDLGGVLVDFDWGLTVRRLQSAFPALDEADTIQCLYRSSLALRYETGGISSREFVTGAAGRLGITIDFEFFQKCWNGIFSPIRPMIDFLSTLRGQYRLVAISNTNPMHMAHLKSRFEFITWFDEGIYSYEAGCLKPERAIFEAALGRSRAIPGECFFLDDRQENVHAARSMGIAAYRVTDPDEAIGFFNGVREYAGS
jgi:HAD superfamily hydrolase (TIGR01509 family)